LAAGRAFTALADGFLPAAPRLLALFPAAPLAFATGFFAFEGTFFAGCFFAALFVAFFTAMLPPVRVAWAVLLLRARDLNPRPPKPGSLLRSACAR